MNIVRVKEKVQMHIDRVKSPRLDNFRFNLIIQTATSDFINDRYDNFKKARGKTYAFETIQRIKDELRTIIVIVPLTPVNNKITIPTDYMHEIGFDSLINGLYQSSSPVTFNELGVLNKNVHTRPTPETPVHFEYGTVIESRYGGIGNFTSVNLSYLQTYLDPFISDIPVVAGLNVLVVGQTYYVVIGTVTHNGTNYTVGQTFVAVNTVLSNTGTVVNIVNLPLPDITHEEIAKRAADIYSGSVENYNRSAKKKQETVEQ